MKNNLTTDDQAGWYECRFIRNAFDCRTARWWSGTALYYTPYRTASCDVREYTEFVALVPWQEPNGALSELERFQKRSEFAANWYMVEEVEKAVRSSGSSEFGAWPLVPAHVYSHEFAVWLTSQLRLAMAKGIQIGRGRD